MSNNIEIVRVERDDKTLFYSAEDHDESIFYNAATPIEAVAGVQIMAAIDRHLPVDEDNEDERHALWMKLTNEVVKAVFHA